MALHLRKAIGALAALGTQALAQVRSPVYRPRWFILLASCFVCGYALSVFAYVLSLPDIGLRCAFSPVVNRSDPSYAPKGQSWPDLRDYTILQLGDQKVESWPQLLRVLLHTSHCACRYRSQKVGSGARPDWHG